MFCSATPHRFHILYLYAEILRIYIYFPKLKLCVIFSFLSPPFIVLFLFFGFLFHLLALITIARRILDNEDGRIHTHANREHTHTQIASDSQNFMRSKSIESIKFAMYVFILCLILSREHVDNSMPPLLLPMGVCSCVYLWFVLFVRNVILWLYECATIIIMTISSCQGTNEGHAKHNARKYVNRKW